MTKFTPRKRDENMTLTLRTGVAAVRRVARVIRAETLRVLRGGSAGAPGGRPGARPRELLLSKFRHNFLKILTESCQMLAKSSQVFVCNIADCSIVQNLKNSANLCKEVRKFLKF